VCTVGAVCAVCWPKAGQAAWLSATAAAATAGEDCRTESVGGAAEGELGESERGSLCETLGPNMDRAVPWRERRVAEWCERNGVLRCGIRG
jgi:hypothetical protein